MNKLLLAIPCLAFTLLGPLAKGQGATPDAKPSDCLYAEKSIRPPRTPGNAAWQYFALWDSLSPDDFKAISSFCDSPYLQQDPPKLNPAQRKVCLEHQAYIEGLIRATQMPECDWGAQHQYGADFLLPELSLIRGSYRALRMDFDRCVEDGQGIAAATRLAAMIRLSDQMRTDRTFISGLVASAILSGDVEYTKDFLKSPLATPATARMLLAAYATIHQDDLFGYAAAAEEERWQYTTWPRQVCTGEHAGETYLEKFEGPQLPQSLPSSFILGVNEQQLNADLDRFDRYLSQAIPLWTKPGSEVQIQEKLTEAMEGQYGLAASIRAWTIDITRRNMVRSKRQLCEITSELEAYFRSGASR